jgi:predicted alpha-1,6-mannanase (GH76 family)
LSSWSYNQGVVLGGLVELNRAAPNNTLLPSANKIAKVAIETLADSNMVIHEFCEPQCLPDGTQFKGIFIRNLQMLQKASPDETYRKVIINSANSIWKNDRDESGGLGVNWAGPIQATVDASTHSSALDALVAALSLNTLL